MSVTSVTSKIIYTGSAVVTTEFAYPFRILTSSDLEVTRYYEATGSTSVLTLDTDYNVTGVGESSGGNVILTGSYTTLPSGSKLVIAREMGLTQEVDYIENDPFPAETHERAIDRLTMITQQLQEYISRSLAKDITKTGSLIFPEAVGDKIIGWDASSTYLVNITNPGAQASTSAVAAASSAVVALSTEVASASSAAVAVSEAAVSLSSSIVSVSQGAIAVSSAAVSVSEAAASLSSSVVCVSQAVVATSSSTVSVSAATGAVSETAVSVSAAAGAVATTATSVSAAAGAVSTTVVCVSSSAGAVVEATAAASSATVAVAQAATNYRYLRVTLVDPKGVYDVSPSICLLQSLNAAITVNDIEVTCDHAPGVQISGNLLYADAFIGTASPVVINDFNTTSGVRYDASLISANVTAGKCMYLAFDAQPTASITQVNFNIRYTYD